MHCLEWQTHVSPNQNVTPRGTGAIAVYYLNWKLNRNEKCLYVVVINHFLGMQAKYNMRPRQSRDQVIVFCRKPEEVGYNYFVPLRHGRRTNLVLLFLLVQSVVLKLKATTFY